MKRILIISEQDLAVVRLTELYNSLFGNEKKELYHCKIDIIECEQAIANLTHEKPQAKRAVSNIPQNPTTLPLLLRHTKPHKNLTANNCKEINEMILEHRINVVLIPNFLYDRYRKTQYEKIARAVKKVSKVDVLGLYI